MRNICYNRSIHIDERESGMKDLKETVAEKLVFLRRENKLTQAELAEKLNYSDKSVSKWERGEALPDVEVLVKISRLFNVSLDYLVNENSAAASVSTPVKSLRRNHLIIASISVWTVWVIATLIFVFCQIGAGVSPWTVFVWAVPASCIVAIVFNGIWGKHWAIFLLCSLLVWSIILACYLQFLKYNLWQMFIVGVPPQVIIILWSRLKRSPASKKQKENTTETNA